MAMSPSAPVAIEISNDTPGQMSMTTGGAGGAVDSVNNQTGFVLVLGPIVSGLADAPVIELNAAGAGHFRVTINGSRLLDFPQNSVLDGQRILVEVTQGSAGGYSLSYASGYNFGSSIGIPSVSKDPGSRSFIAFVCKLGNEIVPTLWDCVGFVAGY
jgi:hypothetical protein